ncbi:MAG: hypothetical protein GY851_02835, partial [bacterium]|nr:hypothetical protein [bacterium]
SEVTLENGIVSVTINKATARIDSLEHRGDELLGNGGTGYLQVYVDHAFSSPSTAAYSAVVSTNSMADIAHSWIIGGLEFEFHYVLREGDSGVYSYLIVEYDPARAATTQLEQLSFVFRTDKAIFRRMYVGDDRIVEMPAPEDLVAGTTLSPREATLLADGSIDHKYHYSNYVKDMDVYGWAGNGKGHWMVLASNEYMNGGPTNQELTAHQTTKTPVTLRMIHGAHYGSGVTDLNASDGIWKKVFGPWLIYLNEGDNDDALWADAKNRARREIAAWPYGWMSHPDYPLAAERGTVSGTLHIADGSSPDGALVLLAQPTDGTDDTNWQRQGKDYIFWTQAAADGSFAIEDVRPGSYTLYANVSGVLDEYTFNGVEVATGSNALGTLKWVPRRHGRLVWQIGVADRTAAEYLHGDDFRRWGLWEDYPRDFPNGIAYTIGTSSYATDWNFCQWSMPDGNGGYAVSPWAINFDMDEVVGERAVLTFAIAASRSARLKVLVNGVEVYCGDIETSDGAGHRAGIQGFYQEIVVPFDSSLLSTTSINTVVVEQARPGLFNNIMYDCIRLEVGSEGDLNRDGNARR